MSTSLLLTSLRLLWCVVIQFVVCSRLRRMEDIHASPPNDVRPGSIIITPSSAYLTSLAKTTTTISTTRMSPKAKSGCGGPRDLFGITGTLTTRNYGFMNYPPNALCQWSITAPTGKILSLKFSNFDVEESHDCIFDHVSVYDGKDDKATLLDRVCGKYPPHEITSRGKSLYIRFVSDNVVHRKGFKLTFTAIDPPVPCRLKEFSCGNGHCILASKRCDGSDDCGDRTDEICQSRICGIPTYTPKSGNDRIVGGQEAVPHSWPWIISLKYVGVHKCGASLIDPQWVLTASHCFGGTNLTSRYWSVAAGKTTDRGRGVIMGAEQLVRHENYNHRTSKNDIALVKLKKPYTLSDKIKIACFPSKTLNPGHVCYGVGWGKTLGTCCRGKLKQAALPIIASSTCNSKSWYNGQVLDSMFCAGYAAGGHDACQGDSGGPLVCKVNGRWEQHGLISWGIGCADAKKPGVYTRILDYIPWIIKNMAKYS